MLATYDTANTGSSQNKVAEYFALSGSIPDSAAYEWTGSTAQPGSQIVFDTDSDRANSDSFNVLVGEQVYSTNQPGEPLTDWWYTGGSARAAARGITCPETSGGSGSNCHGTLAQWQAALPSAEVYLGGFSLGSGVQGEGVLKSLTYGSDKYTFAAGDAPLPPADVTGNYDITTSGNYVRVEFKTDPTPDGKTEGTKIRWSIKIGKRGGTLTTRYDATQGSGESALYKYRFNKGTKATVAIYKNDTKVLQYNFTAP